jgi:hypothetical protein
MEAKAVSVDEVVQGVARKDAVGLSGVVCVAAAGAAKAIRRSG